MPFTSPLIARERILLYSEPGCGKSSAVISIAKLLKTTNSDAKIYVIDNDRSYDLMAEVLNISNMEVFNVYEWREYVAALKKILPQLTPHDFLICDLMSEAWSAVQEFYTNETFGDDIGSYFLQAKNELKRDRAFDGWQDWAYINKLYGDFCRPFVYKSPCHVIATATASPIMRAKGNSSVGDDKETLSVFGSVGFKPDGQKRLKHQFNTTIFLHKSLKGEYLMTSVKDRERELVIAKEFSNFAVQYLKEQAGWKID